MLVYVVFVLLVIFIYLKVYKPNQYWKERGVTHIKPYPLVGTMGPFLMRRISGADAALQMYSKFNERYFGVYIFQRPSLLLKDIELIKKIFIKDFDHFVDRNVFITEDTEPLLGRVLFFLQGQKWKNMRSVLSPAFTGSKMRSMFSLMTDCAERLANHLVKEAENNTVSLEMKEISMRYATDVIASCAFGIKCDSYEEKDNEFYTIGKQTSFFNSKRVLKFFGYMLSQKMMKFMRWTIFTESETNYFRHLVLSTTETRTREGIIRPDMIQLLMEAKKGQLKYEETSKLEDTGFATVEESNVGTERKPKVELKDDDIVAQAVLFFAAGFDTTSTALSFMCHAIVANEDVQRKLQNEIDETMQSCNGKLTYESILKMKYLDMVVSETLRKWPPLTGIERLCVKPYTIEPQFPHESPMVIEKGVVCFLSTYGMHYDPKYFPEPEKFDPERFSDENKHNIVPGSYTPFGIGPRNCIGSRFALLEVKAFIVYLLYKLNFVVIEKTQIPLKLSKNSLGMEAEKGFWIGVKLRKK